MAEVCKDIDQGLADLQAAINRLNNRLDALERKQNECCKDKDKPKKNDNNNSDLEKRVSKIEGYVNALDKDIKGITQTIIEFGDNLQGIFTAIEEFFEKAITWIGSAAKLFEVFK
jgi:DNA-binding FrmR family transcriptional regulator